MCLLLQDVEDLFIKNSIRKIRRIFANYKMFLLCDDHEEDEDDNDMDVYFSALTRLLNADVCIYTRMTFTSHVRVLTYVYV